MIISTNNYIDDPFINLYEVSTQMAEKVNKPTSAINGSVAKFDASKNVVDSDFTIGSSVPANANFTDTIYAHPTTAWNKHIPSGRSIGQILKNIGSGSVEWGELPLDGLRMIQGSYNGDDSGIGNIIVGVTPKIVIVTRGVTFAITHSTTSGLVVNTSVAKVDNKLLIDGDGFRVVGGGSRGYLNYSQDVYEYTVLY